MSSRFIHSAAAESNEEGDPAVRAPAAVYPHDTTLAATATDDDTATSCTPSSTQTALTAAADLKFQRRDEDAGVIPPAIRSQETTLPPANPTPYPCGGLLTCATGYRVLLFDGLCICYYLGGGDVVR
ncbi:uncharacterized protein Z520_11203 [Fonsecaea multimorphosa CBS 102226]|uniref:Uncharacterized protein n=1 Tax=Fonsecaea multimorphosa CBS 102226 TaxID=1442371 RepID=A0A0D2I7E5_9EURO|nr:uncharacterized protein Z520_11203 [Fonsecaea multimorphosa CBS 102226]KIX93146.1 hypothetical protein Z520_11203 [Fonsecaea multimorphosa CBS 102226]OAL18346.1 hypothetical protein AYO22_10762 [Fonsecaea multimorphosa]